MSNTSFPLAFSSLLSTSSLQRRQTLSLARLNRTLLACNHGCSGYAAVNRCSRLSCRAASVGTTGETAQIKSSGLPAPVPATRVTDVSTSGNATAAKHIAAVPEGTGKRPFSQRRPLSSTSSARLLAEAESQATKGKHCVRVKFWLQFRTEYGQRIKVVGSHPNVGAWLLQDAPELSWSEGDRWNVAVELPSGGVYEYKYVVLASNGVQPVAWQRGNNSVLAIKHDDDVVEVFDNWEGQPGAVVLAKGEETTRETRLRQWANEIDAVVSMHRAELRRTRMELAASQEDAKQARDEAQRLKVQLTHAQTEQLQSHRRVRELERANQLLKAQLAESSLAFHKALETAQELLTRNDTVEAGSRSSDVGALQRSASVPSASNGKPVNGSAVRGGAYLNGWGEAARSSSRPTAKVSRSGYAGGEATARDLAAASAAGVPLSLVAHMQEQESRSSVLDAAAASSSTPSVPRDTGSLPNVGHSPSGSTSSLLPADAGGSRKPDTFPPMPSFSHPGSAAAAHGSPPAASLVGSGTVAGSESSGDALLLTREQRTFRYQRHAELVARVKARVHAAMQQGLD